MIRGDPPCTITHLWTGRGIHLVPSEKHRAIHLHGSALGDIEARKGVSTRWKLQGKELVPTPNNLNMLPYFGSANATLHFFSSDASVLTKRGMDTHRGSQIRVGGRAFVRTSLVRHTGPRAPSPMRRSPSIDRSRITEVFKGRGWGDWRYFD